MNHRLTVSVHEKDGVSLVRLVGSGTLGMLDALEKDLDPVVKAQTTLVVLDLAQLDFASSLVLGAMVKLHSTLKQQGRMLKMAALQGAVASAIETAHLDWVIPKFDTVEQAMANR